MTSYWRLCRLKPTTTMYSFGSSERVRGVMLSVFGPNRIHELEIKGEFVSWKHGILVVLNHLGKPFISFSNWLWTKLKPDPIFLFVLILTKASQVNQPNHLWDWCIRFMKQAGSRNVILSYSKSLSEIILNLYWVITSGKAP